MQEKEFIEKGARKVRLDEFLADELEGAGYSESELARTPTSTKIVIWAQRPGLVIGRGGSRINELTDDIEDVFDFENPQIEVNEIDEPDADANVVADSIADWLQKGGHAKRVGYTYLRRMKEAGVIGAEIEITGKLSGNRGRTEKFNYGYVKRCGNTSEENVQKGYALARTKPGAIGVKVRIMKELPQFMHRDVDVSKEILHQTEGGEEEPQDRTETIEDIILEADNMTSAELERAIEEKASAVEGETDIAKDEVREAFEEIDEEELEEDSGEEPEDDSNEEKEEETEESGETEEQEEPEETEDDESEESSGQDGSEGTDTDYDEIVSGTISDAKDMIGEMNEPDFDAILEAEETNKNRTTFVDWLESQKA